MRDSLLKSVREFCFEFTTLGNFDGVCADSAGMRVDRTSGTEVIEGPKQ